MKPIVYILHPATKEVAIFKNGNFDKIISRDDARIEIGKNEKTSSDTFPFDDMKDGEWGNIQDMEKRILSGMEEDKIVNDNNMKISSNKK